jgi:large repetitive protein
MDFLSNPGFVYATKRRVLHFMIDQTYSRALLPPGEGGPKGRMRDPHYLNIPHPPLRMRIVISLLALLICFTLSTVLLGQSRGRPQTFEGTITLPSRNGQESPPATLSGIVVSEATGEPLPGATVTIARYFENAISLLLSGEDPAASIPPARTDDKGGFSFAGLRGNAYDLIVQLDGYLPLKLGRNGTGQRGPLTFTPGQQVSDLKVALVKAASVGGRVQTGTQALAGIPIRLFRDDSTTSIAQTSTAADGTWHLTGFAVGRYVLFAGYPIALKGEREQSFVTRINVPDTDPKALDFSLDSKGGFAIRGQLRSNGTRGLPMDPGMRIAVMAPEGLSIQAQLVTVPIAYDSRNGTFEIPGLFPGVYVINAHGDDLDGGCAMGIVPVSNTDVVGLELPLKPCGQ